MSNLRFYLPQTVMLTIEDFPVEIRELADRVVFDGNGRADSPFRMGWRIRAAASLTRNEQSVTWLLAHGFTRHHGYWDLRDDLADAWTLEGRRNADRIDGACTR